ncbi:MAG: NADH:ubiquinone reductase (Na(+)-transporting) subunit B [Bacteroidota bacterium]|nr:MAG: NADH:ubiquinone reductase (Na(+)-transporting) subunit B [Bacteroidota bacterium]
MKGLRNYLNKIKPNFEKGGKLEKFHSLFDSVETLLFVPNKVTYSGSHIRDAIDMKRTMIMVVLAMVPALLFGMWNVGYHHFLSIGTYADKSFGEVFFFGFLKVLPIILVSYGTGLTIEIIFAQIKHHDVPEGFFVTGMLIPLILPVNIPLWMVALATAFAVIIGVEAFGGTGMNIFNPALLARAFLFFAYPSEMSGDKVWVAGLPEGTGVVDGFSGATPLAHLAQNEASKLADFSDMFFGFIPGSIGETSVLAILIGAFILVFTGIGSWKIMLSGVLGALAMGLTFQLVGIMNPSIENAYMHIPAYYHLVMGGFAFGIVFMATDPVSASQTEKGKWIYGFLIGIIAVLIRVVNPAYPEGVMLAILLGNAWASLIDHYVIEANIKKRLKRVKVKSTI